MTQQIASLAFAVDSSDARGARNDLRDLTEASGRASDAARGLGQSYTSLGSSARDFASQTRELTVGVRGTSSAIDELVERVNTLNRAMGSFGANGGALKDLRDATEQLQSLGRMFGTGAAGMELFSRASRNLGMDAAETVGALRRIQQALEGVTAEGRQARSVLENYGVSLQGRGSNEAGAIASEFFANARRYSDSPRTRYDMAAVAGPLSADTLTALTYPDQMSDVQERRRDELTAQTRRSAEMREAATRSLRGSDAARSRLASSSYEWGTVMDGGLLDGFDMFTSRNDQQRRYDSYEAEARATGGMSRSERQRKQIFDPRMYDWGDVAGGPLGLATRTVMRAGSRASTWLGSDEYRANGMALQANYQRDADDAPFGLGTWAGYQWNRAQNLLGNIGGNDPRVALPADIRPQVAGTQSYLNDTQAYLRTGVMDPMEVERRRVIAQAGQGWGINTADFGRMTTDAQMAALGTGFVGDSRRDAIAGRLGTMDEITQAGDVRATGQRGRIRSASMAGLDGGTFASEEARTRAQAQVEAEGKLFDQREQGLLVSRRMREFEEDVAASRKSAKVGVEEETAVIAARNAAIERSIALGEGGAAALGAGDAAASAQRGSQNPRQRDAEAARLNQQLEQARTSALGLNGGAAQQQIDAEKQLAAFRSGGAESLQAATQEMDRQQRFAELLRAATAAFKGDAQAAADYVKQIADAFDRSKDAASSARRDLAGLQEDDRLRRSGNVLAVEMGVAGGAGSGNENMRVLRESRFIRQNALSAIPEGDSRLDGIPQADRASRAPGLLTDQETGNLRERYRQTQLQGLPDRVALSSARRELADLQANPDPRNAGRIAVLSARIRGLSRGDEPENIGFDERDAATDWAGGLARSSNQAIQGNRWGASDAAAGSSYLLGGGMPRQDRVSGTSFSPAAGGDPLVERLVRAEAERLGIDPDFAMSVANTESGGRQTTRGGSLVTSSTGAMGVMQLMPGTARGLGVDPTNTEQNVRGGLTYLKQLLDQAGGDPFAAYAGYNAGPNRASVQAFRAGGPESALPAETQSALARLRLQSTSTYAAGGQDGGGVGATDAAGLLARLYGNDRFAARQATLGAVRSGQVAPGDAGAFEDSEMTRRAAEALKQFAEASTKATLALLQGEERIVAGARSTYDRQQVEARQAIAPETARLRALGRNGEADTRDRQAGAGVDQRIRANFDDEGKQSSWTTEDLRFAKDNWFLPDSELQRRQAINSTRRRLNDTAPNIPESERESRAQDAGTQVELRDMAKQNMRIRDSFYAIGEVGANALGQIGQRGATLRGVLQGVLTDVTGIIRQLATKTVMDNLWKWAGNGVGSLFGGNSGVGAAGIANGTTVPIGQVAVETLPTLAQGGVIGSRGLITAMAQGGGGIFTSPAYVPMANGGTALIGEAGEEAALPLKRGPDGRLGVIAHGGAGAGNTFNVMVTTGGSSGDSARDHDHARKTGQEVARGLEGMVLDIMRKQARPGGMLGAGGGIR